MVESQENQIKDEILLLLKCKANKTETINGKVMKYNLDNDEAIVSLLTLLKDTLINEIYDYLTPLQTEESEKKIREWIKIIRARIFPILRFKLKEFDKPYNDSSKKFASKYANLYDDFYAICAYRSLEMFALYMEFDLPDSDKVFTYNLNCFGGYWYYANQLILDHSIKNIVKRCPTGYGKTYSNIVTVAFIFGFDINADVMYVCGTPGAVSDLSSKLVAMMCKPRFAKVFKYYARFSCEKSKMFDTCQIGGKQQATRLKINGSNKGTSFLCFNKDTSQNGSRSMYHFYDDITDPSKASNVAQHEKDINAYKTEWYKRKYDDNRVFEFFSGTTRSIDDFMSWNCQRLEEDRAEKTPSKLNFNYTTINVGTSKSVFVKVPKIDFEKSKNGVITFPQRYSLEEAYKEMENDPQLFWAMDQQEPQPLEGCPFAWDNIQTYERLPKNNETDCWALLDPARTGKNYASMPIFKKIGNLHYMVDCVYQLKRTEDLLNDFVEKIKKHHITRFHIENNTSTSLRLLLEKILKERGINYCLLTESFTYKNKEDKIVNNEASIRNNMVFPARHLYAQGSDMGKFMKWFTGYSYMIKNAFDDAPDSLAQYSEKFVQEMATKAKVNVIYRKRNY